MNDAELKAYALGYYDGRHEGYDRCPYGDETLERLYSRGYEAGIADYEEDAQ